MYQNISFMKANCVAIFKSRLNEYNFAGRISDMCAMLTLNGVRRIHCFIIIN